MVINGAEYLDLSFDYSFGLDGTIEEVSQIKGTGLNLNKKNLVVDEDNNVTFPLFVVHNCKVQPVRPVRAEEVLIWMQGVKLIAGQDFTIDNEIYPIQKVKIDRRFLSMDKGEFKMIILRPLG